ncbi:DUF4142 domain-containing protein [Methylocystis sp. MJC1]|jgi:putative membrane protein|uniref:DUF4142 domain-containing protein n=1 Tax=Methylocystis sp. MJC1 TaxID=2654282 RepID=UPI0013EADC8B|nr:DUF4142 domain-containing protein [Methylocystis sp. MJC1]KAF2992181.1 hypothetical protein MJC1_00556 [Methylocystis sp. MJC1]MBU6527321.1 DUF4142 domain-containing protein [Methylocystis sp. MJC1]UZX10272.1 DUF4142 domain-containing protein [Methylocystis sp. MJC1]
MKKLTFLQIAAAASLWLTASVPAQAASLDDAQILGIYIQVNSFDIESALLARAQGASAALRKLAAHVAADHIGVRKAAYDLARKCGVTPATPAKRVSAASDHAAAMQRLAALQGAEFDNAYLRHEEAFHAGAIDAAKKLLEPAASCAELRAHLQEILPAFEGHLSQTRAMAREFGAR